ncbi:MAG: PQQ-binding-like beta-propeller repeat protein [Sandaracinaceae bacterium]
MYEDVHEHGHEDVRVDVRGTVGDRGRRAAIEWRGAVAALAMWLVVPGCSGANTSAFSAMYPDNQPSAMESVATRIAGHRPSGSPIAVGLSAGELYAYDLDARRELWRQPVSEPRSAPAVCGGVVVLHEGGRIVGRRARDGGRAFDMGDEQLGLVGGGGDGDVGAFVLSTTGGVGAISKVYITRGDAIATHYELDSPVGVPTVAGDVVLVPWGNQNVSAIDAATGEEIARARSLAGTVSHAEVHGGRIYFGQRGVGRVTPQIGGGAPAEVGWVEPPTADLPGAPPLWRSAYDPPAGPDSATFRIRLAWAPTGDSGAVRFEDDVVYMTFYSMVFGLAPEDLRVRWAHQLDHDVVGARAVPGGVVIADDAGGFHALAASNGAEGWSAEDSGRAPSVVVFDRASFAPSLDGAEAPGLAEQLLSVAQSTDARLVPARAFAVRALASLEDPSVTEHLLALCDDRSLPSDLHTASCASLGARSLGSDAVLRGLRRHAAFLDDTTAPPVGALASAAARMNERGAVPLLVAHLSDPATASSDIAPIADALAALADRSASRSLEDFLWLYHADVEDDAFERGLIAVARAIVTLSGPPGREVVREVIDAPFTPMSLRGSLNDLLEAQARAEDQAQPAEGAEEGDGEPEE